MSLRAFTRSLADGTETKIPVPGNLVFMRSVNAALLVTCSRDRPNQGAVDVVDRTPLSVSQKIKLGSDPQAFDSVTIRNESGSTQAFVVIIGDGDYEAPIAEVSLSTPNVADAQTSVTANAAGVQLVAANPNRRKLWVSVEATGANEVTLAGTQAEAAANQGLQMSPGMSYPIEFTGDLWVARDGAADVVVHALSLEST